MLVSLEIGVGYNTGYTSLLTSPFYSEPIDTVKQFLDHGSIKNIY